MALNQDAGQSERMSRVRIRFKTRDQQQKMSFDLDQDVFFSSETFKDFDKKMGFDKFMAPIFFRPHFCREDEKETFGAILVFLLLNVDSDSDKK